MKAWILEFGGLFSKIAETFENCGIDGETLLCVTEEDIKETCGKGLASKKIWVEIKRLMQRFAGMNFWQKTFFIATYLGYLNN